MKEWPAPGDSIFNSDGNLQHEALLTIFSGTDTFLHYACAFKDSADIVVAAVERGEVSADSVGLAVCYLYRHYIEMMLKGLICLGPSPLEFAKYKHRIADYWKDCRPLLEAAFPAGKKSDTDSVGKCINELAKLDSDGEATRFGLTKKGKPTLRHGTQLSLTNLRDVMSGVANFLEASYDGLAELAQAQAEINPENEARIE